MNYTLYIYSTQYSRVLFEQISKVIINEVEVFLHASCFYSREAVKAINLKEDGRPLLTDAQTN